MNKMLMTVAVLALVGLSACDNKDDTNNVAPAAGETTSMMAPATPTDATSSTTTTTTTTSADTVPAEPVVVPAEAAPAPATTVGDPSIPVVTTDAKSCGDNADLIGKNASDVDQTKYKAVRVIKAGDPVTQDFNPERVNITTDDAGKITAVTCG